MGAPKALLSHAGESFLSRALNQLLTTRTSEILCVTGADYEAVEAEVMRITTDPRVRIVRNEDFKKGILSSIQAGVRQLSPPSEAFLVTLVDLPQLTSTDHDFLMESFSRIHPLLARYRYLGVAAHPAIFRRALVEEILTHEPNDQGLSFLFEKHLQNVWWIDADSRRGLDDVDTREDYFAHISS